MNISISIIPELNFWSILLLICAGQALFLAIIFSIHKKGNRVANRILAVLIFFFVYYFLFITAYWSKYLLEFPHMLGSLRFLNFCWGPLFFLYVLYLLEKRNKFNVKHLLHFVPAILSTLWAYKLFLLNTEQKVKLIEGMFTNSYNEFPLIQLLPSFIFISHLMIYTYLSIRKIKSCSQDHSANNLTLNVLNYQWLSKLSIGFVAFFGSWFIYEIFMAFGVKYHVEVDYSIVFFGVIIVYITAFHAFRQPEIISGVSDVKNGVKYEKSNLSEKEVELYKNKLNQLMEHEKLYLEANINIRDIAQKLAITPHRLSQVINEKMNMNFSDYVNKYRIGEAKERLLNPEYDNFTILSIAFDVGFNNKVTFNNAFKKFTGQTPSKFKATQHSQISAEKVV